MQATRFWVYRAGLANAGEVREFATIGEVLAFMVEQGHPVILHPAADFEWVGAEVDAGLEIYDGYRE